MTEYRITTFEGKFRIELRHYADAQWTEDYCFVEGTLAAAVRNLRRRREEARVAAEEWQPVPETLVEDVLASL